MRFRGLRKIVILVLALIAVLVGLYLCLRFGDPGRAIFGSFAWVVASLAAVATGGNAVEHLAGGGGVWGAAKALLTAAQPAPPTPPAPSTVPPQQ